MKNKSLSEKIFTANNKSKTFIELYELEILLKEFIKRLKEALSIEFVKHYPENTHKIIDKLAGDKLTGKEGR